METLLLVKIESNLILLFGAIFLNIKWFKNRKKYVKGHNPPKGTSTRHAADNIPALLCGRGMKMDFQQNTTGIMV